MTFLFKIYRFDFNESATDFDMGDLEFSFGNSTISSVGNSRLSNMIYVSVSDLIDGLLKLKNGAKQYKFIGADSSFVLLFEANKGSIYVRYQKDKLGPFPILALLNAVHKGLEEFMMEDRNHLPVNGSMHTDFESSRQTLKKCLNQLSGTDP
jgi:hypothetical protein